MATPRVSLPGAVFLFSLKRAIFALSPFPYSSVKFLYSLSLHLSLSPYDLPLGNIKEIQNRSHLPSFSVPKYWQEIWHISLECISPVAVTMNEVACSGTGLRKPGFAPSVFQPLQGMFTECFSAAGLEQVSKTCARIAMSPAHQSSRSEFCSVTTSDESCLHRPAPAADDFYFLYLETTRTIASFAEESLISYQKRVYSIVMGLMWLLLSSFP